MDGKEDSIYPLIEHAVQARFEDIPHGVIEHTLDLLLDTIESILAGSNAQGICNPPALYSRAIA